MKKLAFALSFLLLSSQAFALDVGGVNVAPTVSSRQKTLTPVSYTHLTLPTIYSV